MNKRKTPIGDGNTISSPRPSACIKIMNKRKTPRGDDKFLSGFSSGFYSRLKKQKTPKGDVKYK